MGKVACIACGVTFRSQADADEHVEQSPPSHFLEETDG